MSSPRIFPYDDWPSSSLMQLFNRAYSTGKMTAPDCSAFLDALSNPATSPEELELIDRLYWAIWKGRITVADDANFPCLDKHTHPKPSIRKDGGLHFKNLKTNLSNKQEAAL